MALVVPSFARLWSVKGVVQADFGEVTLGMNVLTVWKISIVETPKPLIVIQRKLGHSVSNVEMKVTVSIWKEKTNSMSVDKTNVSCDANTTETVHAVNIVMGARVPKVATA